MRRRLRLFVLVGLAATAVDVGLFVLLRDLTLVVADILALTAAAGVAYLANRNLTFRAEPSARWVRRPLWFAATAVSAGTVDVLVLVGLDAVGVPVIGAKLVAVATAAVLRWVAYRRILFNEVRRELAQRVDRPPVQAPLRLSVVIPAYAEEGLIGDTVSRIDEVLAPALRRTDGARREEGSDRGGAGAQADGPGSATDATIASHEGRKRADANDDATDPERDYEREYEKDPERDYEIIVVDDGSPDATSRRAEEAGARVVVQERNRGKGAAVRAGVLAARGRAVVFTDADLAYEPALLLDVLARVEEGWDVVVGSRRHDDTNTLVRARRVRELGGRVINLLTHVVLLGNFHDTQCGIKGFRGDVATVLFERCRIDGFAFDVEIFYLAEQDRLSLLEIPVSVTNRPGSSVSIVGDSLTVIADLFRIRRWAGSGRYRPTVEQANILAGLAGVSATQPADQPKAEDREGADRSAPPTEGG